MILSVENIGKVDKAQIEIAGVTVLTGYNSTGKSSICKALYGMTDSFCDLKRKVAEQKQNSINRVVYAWTMKLEPADLFLIYNLEDKISTLFFRFYENGGGDVSIIKEQLNELFLRNKLMVLEDKMENLVNRLVEIFERDDEEYIRFTVSRNMRNIFRDQIGHVNLHKPSGIILEEDASACEVMFQNEKLVGMKYALNIEKKPIYIEPTSILDSYEQIGHEKGYLQQLDQNRQFLEPFLRVPETPQMSFTLEQYERLEKNSKLIKSILYEVTQGRLETGLNDGTLTYHEDEIKKNIACGNIASGLKPFLMIQRLVENGFLDEDRLLIIDEPEVNLHPEWQLQLARVLVLLHTQMNVRVVLSTHSPYFLKAVDHYLQEENKSDAGCFYLTKETDNGLYTVENVTDCKELIYKTMYKPLEELN